MNTYSRLHPLPEMLFCFVLNNKHLTWDSNIRICSYFARIIADSQVGYRVGDHHSFTQGMKKNILTEVHIDLETHVLILL